MIFWFEVYKECFGLGFFAHYILDFFESKVLTSSDNRYLLSKVHIFF